jgi:hypothetical protein
LSRTISRSQWSCNLSSSRPGYSFQRGSISWRVNWVSAPCPWRLLQWALTASPEHSAKELHLKTSEIIYFGLIISTFHILPH